MDALAEVTAGVARTARVTKLNARKVLPSVENDATTCYPLVAADIIMREPVDGSNCAAAAAGKIVSEQLGRHLVKEQQKDDAE